MTNSSEAKFNLRSKRATATSLVGPKKHHLGGSGGQGAKPELASRWEVIRLLNVSDSRCSSGHAAIRDIRLTMDANHTKIVKIWWKTCLFYANKYPIPISILILFLLSYMFMPLVYKVIIYSSPIVGISFIVHKVLLHIDGKKVKKSEQDDKRKKFAKSRRSFKSKYGDRNHLTRRHSRRKSGNINYNDSDFVNNDDIFNKSLMELLADRSLIDKNPKNIGEVNLESVNGRGECSSSDYYGNYGNTNDAKKDKIERDYWDTSADEGYGSQDKAVKWAEDDQKYDMDLGLLETERNKRLEGMMQRRRSKKNLLKNEETTRNNNNGQMSAIKVVKINPFLEKDLCGKNEPGSAPSALLATHNPFDLPYDPHEEKPDLSGDDFHEEFTRGHHKEAMFCRHQSFSLGAFAHPDATHDNRKMSFYQNLATKRFTYAGLRTSTLDDIINTDHNPNEEGESSERVHEEHGTEKNTKEIAAYLKASNSEGSQLQRNVSFDCGPSTLMDDRKADIFYFYGGKKRIGHAPSNSIVSDLQVELSDEETSLKELDLDRERGSWLNLSNLSKVSSEVSLKPDGEEDDTNHLSDEHHVAHDNNPGVVSSESMNLDTVESNYLQEPSGANETSPKSVLERGFSTDQASQL
ncbi:hypothetical protein LXL04_036357 [Taraxacum kok-saghyz]